MRLKFVMALMIATVLGCGQAKQPPIKTVAATRGPAAVSINNLAVSPSSISFSSSTPGSSVAGSASSTITFGLVLGSASNTWTLGVSSATSTFTGGTCTTIPASAITVTCSSVSVNDVFGTSGTGVCSASTPLSTTSKTAASGGEGSIYSTFTVTINFKLTDSWSYIAATSPTCPLSITYTLNAP